jgi:hypothetical protein
VPPLPPLKAAAEGIEADACPPKPPVVLELKEPPFASNPVAEDDGAEAAAVLNQVSPPLAVGVAAPVPTLILTTCPGVKEKLLNLVYAPPPPPAPPDGQAEPDPPPPPMASIVLLLDEKSEGTVHVDQLVRIITLVAIIQIPYRDYQLMHYNMYTLDWRQLS